MALFKNGQVIDRIQSVATAAGTTTLALGAPRNLLLTGTNTQTVVLPDATTLPLNYSFSILNTSTGAVTVNANGGSLVKTLSSGEAVELKVTNIGTAAGVWSKFGGSSGASFSSPASKTANGSVATTDGVTVVDATSGNINLTLPAVVIGVELNFIRKDAVEANTVTLTTNGSDTIGYGGSTTDTIPFQNGTMRLIGIAAGVWGKF